SLGLHLVLATQRPAGCVSDDVRANTALRIALRTTDRADALDVVADPIAASLPADRPGRAVVRRAGRVELVQVARVDDARVGAIVAAADGRAVEPAGAPWSAALPARVSLASVPRGAAGLLDEPDHQAHAPLRWATE